MARMINYIKYYIHILFYSEYAFSAMLNFYMVCITYVEMSNPTDQSLGLLSHRFYLTKRLAQQNP